jgi:methionine-rich copper-binding protein CopC
VRRFNMRTKILLLLALCVLGPVSAHGHDKKLHKGKPVEGEIVSVEPGAFTLKASNSRHKVTLKADTNIEIGTATHAKKDDLKVGQHVAVFGTKLPGGEIVASEVVVETGDDAGHDHGAGKSHDGQHSHEHP